MKVLLLLILTCFQLMLNFTISQNYQNRGTWRLNQLETKLDHALEKLNKLEDSYLNANRQLNDMEKSTSSTEETTGKNSFEKKTEQTLLSIMEAMQAIVKKLDGRVVESSTNSLPKEEADTVQTEKQILLETTTRVPPLQLDSPKMMMTTEKPLMMMMTQRPGIIHRNPLEAKITISNGSMKPAGERSIVKKISDLEENLFEMYDELIRKMGRLQRMISEQMVQDPTPIVSQELFNSKVSHMENRIDYLSGITQKSYRDVQAEMKTIQHLLNLELGMALRAMHNDLLKCSRSSINMRHTLGKVLTSSMDTPWEESESKDDPMSYLVSSRRAQTVNREAQLDDLGGIYSLELVTSKPNSCAQVFHQGYTKSGIYTIWPRTSDNQQLQILTYCDMDTNGGGWTVFQRRGNFGGRFENFTRPWLDYKRGFGKVSQEFWLGNDAIHALSNQDSVMLRIELYDWNSDGYVEYLEFKVSDEKDFYRLTVGNYSGSVPDSLLYHNGAVFSTMDRNNANFPSDWCIMLQGQGGGWWYKDRCYMSKLNSPYKTEANVGRAEGIQWRLWKGYQHSLKGCEMKLRPIKFQTNM